MSEIISGDGGLAAVPASPCCQRAPHDNAVVGSHFLNQPPDYHPVLSTNEPCEYGSYFEPYPEETAWVLSHRDVAIKPRPRVAPDNQR